MKKGYLWLLLGAIPAIGLAALAALNPTNVAETSDKNEALKTRHYKTDLQNHQFIGHRDFGCGRSHRRGV